MDIFSSNVFCLIVLCGIAFTLAYHRTRLIISCSVLAASFYAYLYFNQTHWLVNLLLLIILLTLIFLSIQPLRSRIVSKPILALYRKILPDMSDTEREALEAGTVWWEGELFSGIPNWERLIDAPAAKLSSEEQMFLDGPVEDLCQMINDWQINYEHGDLSEDIYRFIHKHKFLGMIIPKHYGGIEFSPSAIISVLTKINAVNAVAANYISVPNSLGPGELLMKYGTDAQKDHFLPRLANGEEIPCFGLTSPRAGSDATSIPDTGIVCKGTFEGKETIGIKLNFSKRYITLAPIATLIGLGFRLFDPDHLIGDNDDYGITCALIPRDIDGLEIGRRHFPIGAPFINGPIIGRDVFVPIDFIIGGQDMAGKGWRMLIECLSAGRGISLPSASLSGAKKFLASTSAYARIRRQFNIPIGKFEAVQSVLARMAGKTYIMDAAVRTTGAALDAGEEPAVASAILKYHCTELGREIANDAMDIHGGKAAVKGPSNYLSTGYEILPVAITVEGANILTRSLIIFGQGAIRCHPYVFKEMEAARDEDDNSALKNFDQAFFGHIGFTISNACRALFLGLTRAKFSKVPVDDHTKRYYQQINRYSSAFALAADVSMLTLGGALKFKEMLSARLGDLLSMLYLTTMVLKHHQNQGSPKEDLPVVHWACRTLLYHLQEQMHLLLRNLPNRMAAGVLRAFVFPLGRNFNAPSDALRKEVAELMLNDNASRDRLLHGSYLTAHELNPVGKLNALMASVDEMQALEKKVIKAAKAGDIIDILGPDQIDDAQAKGVLTEQEAEQLKAFDESIMEFINVDDFPYDGIGTSPVHKTPPEFG